MLKILGCILAALALSLPAGAADASGKWSGSIVLDDGGNGGGDTAMLIIKQEGATITGTGGGNESDQWPIRNGKIDGSKLTFEVVRPNDEGDVVYKCELVLDGDSLSGDVTATRGPDVRKAKLKLARVK